VTARYRSRVVSRLNFTIRDGVPRHFPNAHVVIGDLLKPPVRAVFDLAFSVGVLHHLPDPAEGFASLASGVRDDGREAFWVYGQKGNEWITRFVYPFREAVTSKLPAGFLAW